MIWDLYADLKAYQLKPGQRRARALRARFDRIFLGCTGFVTLDRLLARLHANKAELLMVLERPEIPLHTNGSENDIRCHVTRRKISAGTRSEIGRDSREPATTQTGGKAWRSDLTSGGDRRGPPLLLWLKLLLRDVHPAVWRRVRLADSLSIADLHRVIQLLMGWDDDHLHRFRIHGRDYGIAHVGGPSFDEDAATVRLAQFGFRPRALPLSGRLHGWLADRSAGREGNRGGAMRKSPRPRLPGRPGARSSGWLGGPPAYAERRRDAIIRDMATDMDAVAAVLRGVADGDDAVLADPETLGLQTGRVPPTVTGTLSGRCVPACRDQPAFGRRSP